MSKQRYIEQLISSMGQLRKLFETQPRESHEQRARTMMQFSALKLLSVTKNSTVGEVARHLNISKSSATQLVERLVKAGLVRRKNDKEDRRIIHLETTALGKRHILNLKKRYTDRMRKVFSKVPEKELIELTQIHTKLLQTLQK